MSMRKPEQLKKLIGKVDLYAECYSGIGVALAVEGVGELVVLADNVELAKKAAEKLAPKLVIDEDGLRECSIFSNEHVDHLQEEKPKDIPLN